MPVVLQERESALDVIVRALDEARRGRGSAVIVSGPAGIGKTSLLLAAREVALEHTFAVASARGAGLEAAFAWGVVRQLLVTTERRPCGVGRDGSGIGYAVPGRIVERVTGRSYADTMWPIVRSAA